MATEALLTREGSPVAHGNALGGEFLPPLVKPISLMSMVRYAAAVWDFIPLHYDVDYAQKRGFPSPPADGQMLGAFLAQLVTDWSGAGSFLTKLDYRLREFVCSGDTLTCHGRVVAERPEHSKHLVDCELWIGNQHGVTVVAPAHATVARRWCFLIDGAIERCRGSIVLDSGSP